jgi:hypothetical protein
MRTRQYGTSDRTSWAAIVLLVVGVGTLAAAVLHPAVAVIEAGSVQAVSGSETLVLVPGEVVVQSTGLVLVSVASTVIGLALAIVKLA